MDAYLPSEVATVMVTEIAPLFVPVTNITDVPAAAIVGTPLRLTSTVVPTNATNRTIIWSVTNAGATIKNNTLNITAAGTVTLRATIINGATMITDYTQDFIITASNASGGGGGCNNNVTSGVVFGMLIAFSALWGSNRKKNR
jgi:uncharacterized protein YjdB